MGSDDRTSVEATNPVLGSLKVSGAAMNTIFTILGFIVTCIVGFILWTHGADTKDANKDLAVAMREMTQAAREQNCLISLPQDRREQNNEICKRISR